jgi:hypothetical protein
LALSPTDVDSFKRQIAYWTDYFVTPANNGGLGLKSAGPVEYTTLVQRIRELRGN